VGVGRLLLSALFPHAASRRTMREYTPTTRPRGWAMALADRLQARRDRQVVAPVVAVGGPIASGYGALAVPAFRTFFIASVVSNIGSWMQIVGQGWLVLQLTDSAFYLGLVGLARAGPTIAFSLFGGVIADRFDRRRVLVVTQCAMLVSALVLAALTWTGVVTVWHILLISFVSAFFFAVDNPTRQALVPDLVGREQLSSAIGLNSAAWNGAAIIGPSIAGALLALISAAGLFFLNGVSYIGVVLAVLVMPQLPRRELSRRSVTGQLADGMGYIRSRRAVWGLLLLIAIPSVLARPYVQLMPFFARNVLHRGATGYGILMAASGVGALAAALATASLGNYRRRGLLVLACTAALGLSLAAFAGSTVFWLSLALVVVVGATSTLMMSVTNTLLQGLVSDEMRGRVLSVYTLIAGGLMPLGSMVLGSAGDVAGVPLVVALGGIVTIATTIACARALPELREMN
jgi:MFS family permease